MNRKNLATERIQGQLTLNILRQFGVDISEPGHFAGDLLELVGHLRELFVGCPEVRSSNEQVLL
jgi:hypothetical protein